MDKIRPENISAFFCEENIYNNDDSDNGESGEIIIQDESLSGSDNSDLDENSAHFQQEHILVKFISDIFCAFTVIL